MLLHLPLLLLLLCTLLEPLARLIGRRWRRGRRRGRYALEICQAFARRCRYWAIVAVRATNVAPDHETERNENREGGRRITRTRPPPASLNPRTLKRTFSCKHGLPKEWVELPELRGQAAAQVVVLKVPARGSLEQEIMGDRIRPCRRWQKPGSWTNVSSRWLRP